MPKTLKGVVISDKMQKTVVVEVTVFKKHPKYKRYFKASKRYKAHDEKNEHRAGETILIQETKPISKEKRWKVIKKSVSLAVTPARGRTIYDPNAQHAQSRR